MSHDVSRAESGDADMPQLTKVARCIVARWHLNQAASARARTPAARGLLLQLLSTALVLYFEQLIAVGVQTTAANERCAYRALKTKFFSRRFDEAIVEHLAFPRKNSIAESLQKNPDGRRNNTACKRVIRVQVGE
jgi:hypothetical protein